MVSQTFADEPLEMAIFRAIKLAQSAACALYSATAAGSTPPDLMRSSARLERLLKRDQIWDASLEHEIRRLAKELLAEAAGERRIGVIDDECFVGDDRTFVTMTDRGSALLSARTDLLELAEALSDIRTLQSAELTADRLRQARNQTIRF